MQRQLSHPTSPRDCVNRVRIQLLDARVCACASVNLPLASVDGVVITTSLLLATAVFSTQYNEQTVSSKRPYLENFRRAVRMSSASPYFATF